MGANLRYALLELRELSKAYAAPVLRGINLGAAPARSLRWWARTAPARARLSRLVAGLALPDGGRMQLAGEPWAPRSRAMAEAGGVRMVLQELGLVPTLSVAENLLLGRLPSRAGLVDRKRLARTGAGAAAIAGLAHLDVDAPVGALGIGQQQLLEIARGLAGNPRLRATNPPPC